MAGTVSSLLVMGTAARAAEDWQEVTVNAAGDRFLVDKNSMQRSQNAVQFWEYREFRQPNNAFLDFEVNQPVYGVMLLQSADCPSGIARTRRVVVFDQNRQVLRRQNYEDGVVSQPRTGSSASKVLQYVCNPQSPAQPNQPGQPSPQPSP